MNSTAPFHVLIIEDSPEDRADLRQMLLRGSQRHYRFTEAETGGAGLRAVREKAGAPPDCVLLDFNLPDMNALDVLADLRGAAFLPPCPVVVVTGANSNSGADVLRAGAQDYIGKEWITPGSLTRTVENAVERFAMVKARDGAQLALRVSEERFRLAAQVAGLAVAEIDYTTDQVHLSPESAAMFGLPPQPSVVSRATIHALFHPDDRPALEKFIAASHDPKGTGEFAMDHRIIRPDRQVRWHGVRKQVFFEQARPARALLAIFDITTRKLRERHLVFLAQMQKVFAPLTSSTEIMRAVGERLAEHLGLVHCILAEVDEAADTCTVLHDHHAPGTRNLAGDYRLSDFHPEEERLLLASGAPLVIANLRDGRRTAAIAEHFEALGIRALVNAGYVTGGRWRFVLQAFRAEPYAWPAEEVELLTELAARIYVRVERSRAEEALRESNVLLDTLLTRAPIGFCMLDRELRYVRINDMLAEFNGIPVAAHLGRALAEVVPGLEASVRAITELILRTGEAVCNHEFCGETAAAQGSKRYWNESWYPVCDGEGKIVGFGGVVEEITARKKSEETMARLAAIVHSSHDALFSEDLDGIVTSWNPGAEQIFGYRAEEIVGTSIMRLMPADRQAAERGLQRQIVDGELGGTFEEIRLTKDGREFPASITIAPLKDAAGKVIGTSRVLRDVTERKRAEEVLRENAAVFSTLIAQAPMGTYVVDAQFRMRQINAEAMPAFGSVHPLIGRDFQEVVEILWGPEVGGTIIGVLRHTLATGERFISPPFTEQRHDVGIKQTYEWEMQRVTLPDGQHGVVCYFQEVTERARAAEALRASQERMHLAAEATGVGIWEWNAVTNAIRWDAMMFQIYGIEPTPDRLVHYQDWRGAVLPEELAENEAILQETIRRGGQSTREFRIQRRSDGECRWIHAVETVRANHEGTAEWVLGTNLDVTERKNAEQTIRDEAKRKDEFLAMLGHELRNPLAAIRHAVQIAHETPDDHDACHWAAGVIDCQSAQLSRMVDDLLDVARINRGRIDLRPETLDLQKVLESAIAVVQRLVRKGRHHFIQEIGSNLRVTGDAARLQQVYVNLLNNAAKYTPETGTIRLEARCEGAEVIITISDNGVGIPSDLLPHVFDLFRQADSTLDRSQGGLGIGLSVVKSLVEMHHGRITVESRAGTVGTTVTVRLPLLTETGTVPATAEVEAGSASLPNALRVLIVDDHQDAALGLAQLLKRRGCEVSCAHTGPDGLTRAREFHPQVLLLDLGLPGFDGYELARLLRAEPDFREAILIAISGYAQDGDRARCHDAGFDGHFAKPINFQKLLEAIQLCSAG